MVARRGMAAAAVGCRGGGSFGGGFSSGKVRVASVLHKEDDKGPADFIREPTRGRVAHSPYPNEEAVGSAGIIRDPNLRTRGALVAPGQGPAGFIREQMSGTRGALAAPGRGGGESCRYHPGHHSWTRGALAAPG